MTIQSRSTSTGGTADQASRHDTLSGTTSFDDTVERMHHGRLAKLDLSDGKSLFAKLVVIILPFLLKNSWALYIGITFFYRKLAWLVLLNNCLFSLLEM